MQIGNGWIRLWRDGPGLSWTTSFPLFSERYGYRKPLLKVGKFRMFYLRRINDYNL